MDFGDGIGGLKQTLNSAQVNKLQTTTPGRETSDAAGISTASKSTQVDETSLSKSGSLIAKTLEGSDVRTAKVEALQRAIADGSYSVPASAVADKIIQSQTD